MNSASGAARLRPMAAPTREDSKPLACAGSEWLPCEASARRYARLTGLRLYDLPTAVAMLFPRGTPAAEVRRVAQATQLLAAAGVPVPTVHDSDPKAGWILQEDLGDVSLATAVAAIQAGATTGPATGAGAADALYREALGLLPAVARLGHLPTSPRPPLDAVRLHRELELFASAALVLDGPPGRWLADDLRRLVDACSALPTVLCHRDYHARNLMLAAGRVRVIDHQDALPGPEPYDRVSLAYDPYVALDDRTRDALAGDAAGTAAVAVQRLCKAIGTFADKGAGWRGWIAPAARQARRLLERDALRMPVLDASLAALAVPAP